MFVRIFATAAAFALAALSLLTLGAVPAAASCATDRPLPSAHRFTGVVVATKADGRVATVRTDGGAVVQVRGTPSSNGGVTSVDRTYRVGARYEFHPTNAAPPWQDNACTATRLLSVDETAAVGAKPRPTASTEPPMSAAAVVAVLAVGAVLAGLAVRGLRRRHRSQPTAGGAAAG